MKLLLPLLFLFPTTVHAQDSTSRISQDLLTAVLKITNGQKMGTGFLVCKMLNEKTKQGQVFLVTNKHVIGEWSMVDSFILSDSIKIDFRLIKDPKAIYPVTVRLKNPDGTKSSAINIHPDHKIDIAVINLTSFFNQYTGLSNYSISHNLLLPISLLKDSINLGDGSQVFALGYPAGLKINSNNLALAKAGYITSPLTGDLNFEIPWINRQNKIIPSSPSGKFFLIEGAIIGGNSGGPVVNPSDIIQRYKNGLHQISSAPISNYILGIVSSSAGNTGFSIIYASDHIIELLY